ncbi:unnamed protein product [Paramecium sonneborni]|uniref:Uncharacterized protein n=1 Tax=Paramecium sonneborni TaxID=65129 RepID=A0A8S1M4I5_9CILI|nr:unnamed protein product [Paramecium sonneborni]
MVISILMMTNIQKTFLEKLNLKVQIAYNKNHIPIVIGGSKDCVFGILSDELHVISKYHIPDIQIPYDENKSSINLGLKASKNKISIIYFGYDNSRLNQDEQNHINAMDLVYRKQDSFKRLFIKIQNLKQNRLEQCLIKYLKIFKEKEFMFLFLQKLLILLSVLEQVGLVNLEIVYLAGKHTISLDITDYNPTIEDYGTGFLLGNLIYYYILSKGKNIN